MSLEALIAENTAVQKELLAATRELIAIRTEAIETVRSQAEKPKSAPRAAKTEKPVEDDAPKANISQSPEDRKDPAADGSAAPADPTLDDVSAAVKGYIGEVAREEEQAARKARVAGWLKEKKLTKIPDLPAKHFGGFIKMIGKWQAEGELTSAEPETADEDDMFAE